MVILKKKNQSHRQIGTYIYIYIERGRERERLSQSLQVLVVGVWS